MSNYFRNNIRQNNPEKKKIYTYYPKFNQKNINFESNQHKLKENNNKYIYLDDPYDNNRSNDLNHPNKINNCNVYNNNSIKYNYNNNIIFKKRNRNQFENINIKNYYFFNSSRDENTYDEYIIDYKAGLNNNFYKKKVNLNKIYNNLSLQNWRNKNLENESNRIYNKSTITGNNNNIINNKEINKNNTYDGFYHLNNSKGKKKKMNMEAPYKRRIIINDYNFNYNSSIEHNDNVSINHINRAKHSLISKKILKRNNTSDNYKENKIFENRKQINNNLYHRNAFNKESNYIHKKGSFILSKSSKTNKNVSLTKIMNFIQHLSKYCSSYYSKIIKQLFESLKAYNNMDKNKNNFTKINNRNINKTNSNINLTKKSRSPFNHIKKKNVNYGVNRKRNDKINETLISNKSSDILIERIKARNESLSPNSRDYCEMFRNINELNKKYETISVRKNKNNNHSLKKDTNEVSFNSENKSFGDRFSSIERNKEKWENTINTERERKRRILEKKSKNKNNNIKAKTLNVDEKEKREDKNENNISKLIEKSRILKNKIKKLEQKNKRTIEVNWNLDAITIKAKKVKKTEKEKEREKEKDFSFGDENKEFFNSSNSNFGNSGTFNIHELIGSDKFDKNLKKNKNNMIKVKKIITKDKRIYINMNYLNYLQNPGNKNKKITNCELYKISHEFNIDLFGDKNKANLNLNKTDKENNNNINNDEKVKYINKLTQITEEENKVDLSENISQSSTENIAK